MVQIHLDAIHGDNRREIVVLEAISLFAGLLRPIDREDSQRGSDRDDHRKASHDSDSYLPVLHFDKPFQTWNAPRSSAGNSAWPQPARQDIGETASGLPVGRVGREPAHDPAIQNEVRANAIGSSQHRSPANAVMEGFGEVPDLAGQA